MAKKALLFHGTGSGPRDFWLPWLIDALQKNGMEVWAPDLPQKDAPDLSVWTPWVLERARFDEETIMIGHSAGAPLILSLLQKIPVRIEKAVLVAGFVMPIPKMPPDHPMLMQNPDWEKMRRNCRDFTFIHSDNDPWGCDAAQGEAMRQKLGGTLVVMTGQGHFGSNIFKQPYPAFPMLRDVCLQEPV
ncbi:MAG: alpha/beta fold hydrolase [Alphaproteobacteria bacterium]|nr:alpha/beta fold hydrolase [Alphaproteobacteria bacterium]